MAQNDRLLKGIIFDKDGTLFDYVQVWASVLNEGIERSFAALGKEQEDQAKRDMLSLLGIDPKGRAIPNGLVFTHNKASIVFRYLFFCIRYGINPVTSLKQYRHWVTASEPLVEKQLKSMDFSVQQSLFSQLKREGYRIGIITNDTESSSRIFLERMEVEAMVDFLSSRDSGTGTKPHSKPFRQFCSRFGLSSGQVAVVGDTVTDMKFARNAGAGYRVAVLSGSNDEKRLSRLGDVVYPDISFLFGDRRIFPGYSNI